MTLWYLPGLGSLSCVSEVTSCCLTVLVLSILSNLLIPWKNTLMELAITSAKIGSLHKILFLLGILSTCSDVVLCVLLAGALVLLDWLALLHFFELHTFTLLSPAWAGRASLAAGCRSALSRLEVTPILGAMLHDWGGYPWGCLMSSCCGGGGMPSSMDSECCGQRKL